MHICIIETDRPRPELQSAHGTYGEMIENWIGISLPEAEFSHIHIEGGEPLPDPERIDGFLLSGSRHSAYDDFDWIADLKQYLRMLRDRHKPVGGICFGHQVMAEAYGGKVEKSQAGWAVGRHIFRPTPAGSALFPGADEIAALSWHQDQVVRLPEEAEILLANQHSPHTALAYSFPAMSVQFHPEFSPAYVDALLTGAAGRKLPEGLAGRAAGTLDQTLNSDIIADAFARFYRSGIPT